MLIRWPLRDVQLSTQRWEISEYEQLCEWLWENHHIVASWTKVLFIHPQHNIVCDLVDVDLASPLTIQMRYAKALLRCDPVAVAQLLKGRVPLSSARSAPETSQFNGCQNRPWAKDGNVWKREIACTIELFRIAKGKKAGLRAGECVHFVGFDSQARCIMSTGANGHQWWKATFVHWCFAID